MPWFHEMNRREALRQLGLLAGGAASASALAGVFAGCRAGGPDYKAVTLVEGDQYDRLGALCDLIIPETDTPGARAAGVPGFIDRMLTHHLPEAERDRFLAGLADVETRARSAHQSAFTALSIHAQTAMLQALHDEAVAGAVPPSFFAELKGLTLLGYYTSEIGATRELRLMPIGRYDGDVPFSEIGRTWSSDVQT